MSSALVLDDTSQDKILYQMKRLGPRTARELAALLEMTTMGMRQHLSRLEDDGLVTTTPEEAQGRGRPVKRWKLTEAGHGRFPDGHAQVSADLIVSIRDLLGEDAMTKIIDKRTQDTFQHYQSELAKLKTLKAKLNRLSQLRSAEGYMAEVEATDGGYLLIENHCPICIAASSCQGFCDSELSVFQQLFVEIASVSREQHLLDKARRCSYRVIPL